jgi:hypothetical protein
MDEYLFPDNVPVSPLLLPVLVSFQKIIKRLKKIIIKEHFRLGRPIYMY